MDTNFSFGFGVAEFSDRILSLRSPTKNSAKREENADNPSNIKSLDDDVDAVTDSKSPDEQRIHVCGLILAKGAEFFKALFTQNFQEKQLGEYAIEVLKKDWPVYIGVIRYLYNPEDPFLYDCNLQDILLFLKYADQMVAKAPMEASIQRLSEVELTPDICDSFLNLSLSIQKIPAFQLLKDKVQEYLVKTFQKVEEDWISDDFLQLGVDSILLLLQSDKLVTRAENSLWTLLVRWLENDDLIEERKMKDLYPFIRFPTMTPSFLVDVVQNSEYFRNIPEIRELVYQSVNYLAQQEDPDQLKWIRKWLPEEEKFRYVRRTAPPSKLRVFNWEVSMENIRNLQENQSIDSPVFISGGYAFDLFIKREQYFGLYLEFLPHKTKICQQFRLPKATWSVWARCKSNGNSPKCLKATSKNFTSDMRPGLGFGHANVFNLAWEHLTDENFDFCIDGRIWFTVKLEGI